jgi:anti-sigma B factor antagonist
MEFKVETEGTKATIAVEGKLTVQTSPELEAGIGALPEDITELVIDLENVDYISSAGLRVLVATQKMISHRSGSMTLVKPVDEVYEVFEMTGLSDVFTIER